MISFFNMIKILLVILLIFELDILDIEDVTRYLNDKLTTLTLIVSDCLSYVIELFINIAYYIIYGLSICELQLNKLYIIVSPPIISLWNSFINFAKENKWITEITTQMLIFIDNYGNKTNIWIITKENFKQINYDYNYSGIMFLDKNFETNCVNKIYYTSYPDSFIYMISTVCFMTVQLEHNNITHTIVLKSNKDNYYIVGNCLNQLFFKYYLKNVLKVQFNEDNFNYKLTIIDDNVNIITIDETQYIIFNLNDYNIKTINFEYKEEKEKEENEYKEEKEKEENEYKEYKEENEFLMNDEVESNESDKSDGFVNLDPN